MATLVTVLISAFSALLTTLVTEYFAKPALEARKQRLIRNAAQIDEVVFVFQQLGLQFGAVVNKAPKDTLQQQVRSEQITELADTIDDLMRALSRLSPKYAEKHTFHISSCAKYLGYIKGLSKRNSAGFPLSDELIVNLVNNLSLFDVYFRVYPGLRDSNESWVKRVFWRRFTKNSNRAQVEAVVSKI